MNPSGPVSFARTPLLALPLEATNTAPLTPVVAGGMKQCPCQEQGEEQRKRQRIHDSRFHQRRLSHALQCSMNKTAGRP